MLGFGSSDLRRRLPPLITCHISGFGDAGLFPAGRLMISFRPK
ncbi:CoA transferase [Mesorhizobium sp. WSM3859]|nr:CoA transferase [Mesorhizobium sp. WSM3859]